MYAKVVEVFGADLRSLATFRIVLALLVLSDLASRATDLTAHYTDAGVMPRTDLLGQVLGRWQFSLNLISGGALFQALLFGPFFTAPVRTGTALAFMSLHFGIWLTMDIGIFPWISAFCMVCFFPAWFWERATALHSALLGRSRLARRLQSAAERSGHAIVALSRTLLSSAAERQAATFCQPRAAWRPVGGLRRGPAPGGRGDGKRRDHG